MKQIMLASRERQRPEGPPLRQLADQNAKNLRFSRQSNPLTPFLLAGRGGSQSEMMLDVPAFLAIRQFPALAEWPRNDLPLSRIG